MYLISIDPGSSDKGWSAWCAKGTRFGAAGRRTIPIKDLSGLVDDICSEASADGVSLSLDAPLRAFGGVQAPLTFAPASAAPSESRKWPFNVNAFAQRACEKALTSRPTVRNESLAFKDLAHGIGRLCGWTSDYKERQNASFSDLHPGVSVLGYMGAPHTPVVRTFLSHLARQADANGIDVVFTPPVECDQRRAIHVVETHPAVALGFYASLGVEPFPASIPVYKGGKGTEADFEMLSAAVVEYVSETYATRVDVPANDDELDALIGLLNLSDLANGRCDLFGTVEDGYFLVPSHNGQTFADLWARAVTHAANP